MKFEEILPLMREGKKAKHSRMKDGEFWMCCTLGFGKDDPMKFPTLAKMFTNPFHDEVKAEGGSYNWGIERWAIMCDDWEIVD
jgi:hypothetical protein